MAQRCLKCLAQFSLLKSPLWKPLAHAPICWKSKTPVLRQSRGIRAGSGRALQATRHRVLRAARRRSGLCPNAFSRRPGNSHGLLASLRGSCSLHAAGVASGGVAPHCGIVLACQASRENALHPAPALCEMPRPKVLAPDPSSRGPRVKMYFWARKK